MKHGGEDGGTECLETVGYTGAPGGKQVSEGEKINKIKSSVKLKATPVTTLKDTKTTNQRQSTVEKEGLKSVSTQTDRQVMELKVSQASYLQLELFP